jgi:hypothetical protein
MRDPKYCSGTVCRNKNNPGKTAALKITPQRETHSKKTFCFEVNDSMLFPNSNFLA